MIFGPCCPVDIAHHAQEPFDTIILGAGIAGMFAARTLADSGRSVAVFDKGGGVGGRMATRRIGDAVLDHGAQYFTARDPQFRAWVEGWLKDGLVNLWSDGFATATGKLNQNGEPRYIGSRGMTTIPKRLAEGLIVILGATAIACRWLGGLMGSQFQGSERRPRVGAGPIARAHGPRAAVACPSESGRSGAGSEVTGRPGADRILPVPGGHDPVGRPQPSSRAGRPVAGRRTGGLGRRQSAEGDFAESGRRVHHGACGAEIQPGTLGSRSGGDGANTG